MIYTVTLNPALDRELVVGEIERDVVLRATESRADVGGKGFNVSRSIAALGGRSIALGFAGGKTGEMLAEGLDAAGIEHDFVWIEHETRTNTSVVSTADHSYIKVNEAGPEINEGELNGLIEQVKSLAKAGDYWVFGGSLPRNVPTDIYKALVEIVQAAGAFAVLDTSKEALRLGLEGRPFLIKPNDEEAMALTGAETIESAAGALLEMGAETVVMSLGKAGAMVVSWDEGESDGKRFLTTEAQRTQRVERIDSFEIVQRNPIGAGDSMVGGIVYGLVEGFELHEAVRWGMACGAAAAAQYGTAMGSREDVMALLGG